MENQHEIQEEFDWSLVELDEEEEETTGGARPTCRLFLFLV